MHIISLGYGFRHGKSFNIMRPRGLNHFLVLIIRSEARMNINGIETYISPNSMILLSKGTPHSIYAVDDFYINDWVAFDTDISDEKAMLGSIVPDMITKDMPVLFCSEIIKLMQEESRLKKRYSEKNIIDFLHILLRKMSEDILCAYDAEPHYRKLKQIRDDIYNNPCERYTIDALAGRANLSGSHFHHLYKKYFNISPVSDVIISRIQYSRQLLASTNYTVARIADMLGYVNEISFIKQFKAVTKTTPGRYRKTQL